MILLNRARGNPRCSVVPNRGKDAASKQRPGCVFGTTLAADTLLLVPLFTISSLFPEVLSVVPLLHFLLSVFPSVPCRTPQHPTGLSSIAIISAHKREGLGALSE